ncbi:hypothetical protein HY090_02000 [Candidatus Kaiserbacteria bacterium]|nr:hypothetical protein [Candidatus Kaiserbacteria bacterium]
MSKNPRFLISIIVVCLVIVFGVAVFLRSNTPTPPTNEKIFTDTSLHYSISYPADFTLNTAFSYDALGPDTSIKGVSFTIPPTFAAGTNLSPDSYFSVESMATSTCSALSFLGDAADGSQSMTDGGATYDFAKGGGAAAGNFYEEYVYALKGSKPCIAMRYFIHSTNIANYTTGTVREFDKTALVSAFDAMRRSFAKVP